MAQIYNSTWWGSVCSNTISWGIVYRPYANCVSFNLIAENSDNLIAENGDNLVSG